MQKFKDGSSIRNKYYTNTKSWFQGLAEDRHGRKFDRHQIEPLCQRKRLLVEIILSLLSKKKTGHEPTTVATLHSTGPPSRAIKSPNSGPPVPRCKAAGQPLRQAAIEPR